MSVGVVMAMVIAALVICIFASTKFDLNGGVLALAAAWVVGCVVLGQKIATLISYWPMSVMFIILSTSLFFNVPRANGTLDVFAGKLLYKVKGAAHLIPFMFFLVAWCVAALGAGAVSAQLFLAPIAYTMAKKVNIHPLIMAIANWSGAVAGGGLFWPPEGASRVSFYAQAVGDEVALESCAIYGIYAFALYLFLVIFNYFIYGGYKAKGTIEMDAPPEYTPEQKKTMTVLLLAIAFVIIPAFAKLLFPNPVTIRIASMFDIQSVCIVGFVIYCFMGLCNEKKIISSLPIGLILTVCGFSVLIKVAIEYNLPQILADMMVNSGMPAWTYPVMFLFIAGFISIFSNFAVIYPLLMPIVPIVVQATGVNSMALLIGLSVGSVVTGFSPFSTGGACQLTGISDPDEQRKIVPQMLRMALVNWVVMMAVAATGIFNLYPDPLL